MKCIVCQTEFIPDKNGQCTYCEAEKAAAREIKKTLPLALTAENYFSPEANREYMEVSQFKAFEKCEAAAMAQLKGECEQPKSTALLVGSYVDAHFEGTLDIFKAQNPEIFCKTGKNAGQLKSDYAKADEIINRIEQDKLFMQYMSGEKQVIKTAELFGTKWKIKIDSYLPGDKIVDLKCMRSMERIMGVSFVEHWGYDIQGAVYQAIEGNHLPFYLAVATKEDTTNLELIHIPQWRLDECLHYVEQQLPHILKVKNGEIEPERCGVCDYCKQTKVLTKPIDFEDVGFSTKELKAMRGIY